MKVFKTISSGVFLQDSHSLISEQIQWDDEDEAKNIDFSAYPLWITTDDGATPIGVHSEDEAFEKLR